MQCLKQCLKQYLRYYTLKYFVFILFILIFYLLHLYPKVTDCTPYLVTPAIACAAGTCLWGIDR